MADGIHNSSRHTEPAALDTEIQRIPGALECGLFAGLARAAVIARGEPEGGMEVIEFDGIRYRQSGG